MKKVSFLFAALIASAMVLSSCGSGSTQPKNADSTNVEQPAADSTPVADTTTVK
jgi:PBP1b-binding outer membrane lipoprotein LpoB